MDADDRVGLREGMIALAYLLIVGVGIATVLWPELEDQQAGTATETAASTDADGDPAAPPAP